MVVDRFFFWVAEASVEQRLAAVGPLVRAFFADGIAEDERETIEAALTLVADDYDAGVRRALAEALAETETAPRHILHTLLIDQPEIAAIVARHSEALIAAELIELVGRTEPEIHRAVARRRRVEPSVAAALAEVCDRATAVTLLANCGADLSTETLDRLVERFGTHADLREALMARPHVPITVRHRVLERLAEAIGEVIVARSRLSPEAAETLTRDARDKATVALAGGAGAGEARLLVEHLRRTGRLTTRLLLRAACVGDLRFVEEALALLAGVPSARVAALVADGRENAFRALCLRSGIPERACPAFLAAVEVHRALLRETGGWDGRPGDRARFGRRLIERVLTRYGAFDRRDGDDLLLTLRRFADDAARDRVRAVMTERMAAARAVLVAPRPVETVAETDAAVAPAADVEVEIVDVPAGAASAMARPPVPVEPVLDFEAVSAAADDRDDDRDDDLCDAWGGLFAHLRPEDLPEEWLVEEPETVLVFGDERPGLRDGEANRPPHLTLVADEPAADGDAVDADLSGVFDEMEAALGAGLRAELGARAA